MGRLHRNICLGTCVLLGGCQLLAGSDKGVAATPDGGGAAQGGAGAGTGGGAAQGGGAGAGGTGTGGAGGLGQGGAGSGDPDTSPFAMGGYGRVFKDDGGGRAAFHAVEVDSQGGLLLGGDFYGQVDFDGSPSRYAGGSDAVMLRLEPSRGLTTARQRFLGAGSEAVTAMRQDTNGAVYVAGYSNTADLMLETEPWPSASSHTYGFVMLWRPLDNTVVWKRHLFSTRADVRVHGLVFDASAADQVIVVGEFADEVAIDVPATPPFVTGKLGAFALALHGSSGLPGGFAAITGPQGVVARSVAVDAQSRVVVAGDFDTEINGQLTAVGGLDAFAAGVDLGQGTITWSRRLGGMGQDRARAIGTDGTHVWVLGSFAGHAETNDGFALDALGGRDGFVLRLDDRGQTRSLERIGGSGDDGATSLVLGPDGRAWIAGFAGADLAYRGFPAPTGAGGRDVFVLGLDVAGAAHVFARIGGPGDEGGDWSSDDLADVVLGLSADARALGLAGTFRQSFSTAGVSLGYPARATGDAAFAVLLPLR